MSDGLTGIPKMGQDARKPGGPVGQEKVEPQTLKTLRNPKKAFSKDHPQRSPGRESFMMAPFVVFKREARPSRLHSIVFQFFMGKCSYRPYSVLCDQR